MHIPYLEHTLYTAIDNITKHHGRTAMQHQFQLVVYMRLSRSRNTCLFADSKTYHDYDACKQPRQPRTGSGDGMEAVAQQQQCSQHHEAQ